MGDNPMKKLLAFAVLAFFAGSPAHAFNLNGIRGPLCPLTSCKPVNVKPQKSTGSTYRPGRRPFVSGWNGRFLKP